MRLRNALSFIGMLLIVVPASADTFDYSNVVAPPVPTPNAEFESVIKWCDQSGNIVRYTSSDLSYKGHKPCGELKNARRCDATGQRYIGPTDNAPHGYLDCDGRERLFIELDKPVHEPIARPEQDEVSFQPAGYTNSKFSDFDALLDGTSAPSTRSVRKKKSKNTYSSDDLRQIEALLGSNGGRTNGKNGDVLIEDVQQMKKQFQNVGDLNEALNKLLDAFQQ